MATRYDTIYIDNVEYLLIAVDIGNSRIKLLTGNNYLAMDYSGGLKPGIDKYLSSMPDEQKYICISSVNDEHLTKFMNFIGPNDRVDFVEGILEKQKILKYDKIEGIGPDRLLGLIGALTLASPPLITVDCGTAVTVNALDKNSNCIGGAIFAGASTQIDSMAGATERLSQFDLNDSLRVPGKTTEEAINSGVILSIVGGIKEIIQRITINEFNGDEVEIFITGGYSEIIAAELANSGFKSILQPQLVLLGIIELKLHSIKLHTIKK